MGICKEEILASFIQKWWLGSNLNKNYITITTILTIDEWVQNEQPSRAQTASVLIF